MFKFFVIAATLAVAMSMAAGALAGAPTDKIRERTDSILAIVADPELSPVEKRTEKYAKIRAEVDKIFDWAEMAKRSLGRYWAARSPEEKEEFTKIFSDLIERTYMDRVEGYSGQTVKYMGETLDDGFAKVQIVVVDQKNTEVQVEYRMMNKNNNWLIYDVSLEGVSLVNNYRTQFSDILSSGSYQDLVKRIKTKLEENKTY